MLIDWGDSLLPVDELIVTWRLNVVSVSVVDVKLPVLFYLVPRIRDCVPKTNSEQGLPALQDSVRRR